MIDEKTRKLLRTARDNAEAAGLTASFGLHFEKSQLMRIGNNSVSLNTSEHLTRLDIEVINGRRQGSHTHLGAIENGSTILAALNIAVDKAKVSKPLNFDPIPDLVEETVEESEQYDPALAELDPVFKADAYAQIFEELGEGYNFSGSWSSGVMEKFIVTTGTSNEGYHKGTDQQFTIVLKDPVNKWELSHAQTGWKLDDFSVSASIDEFKKLLSVYSGNDGFKVQPGDYTVVFGAEAVAEIVGMALWTGLSGRGWEEKRAWTADAVIGDMILGENITILDDPLNALTFNFGFDSAGIRRKKFTLVEKGVFRNLMYDASTAAKYGKKPTGHNLGSPSICMECGSGATNFLEAVNEKGRVLYIPALHYVNLPSIAKGIFTGSSRFSALLIEGGKVVSPIFSTRVTDSFENILGNVSVISSRAESVNGSNTYGRRTPRASTVPSYIVAENVRITDSADSF